MRVTQSNTISLRSKEVKEDQIPVAVSKSMVMEEIENGCGTKDILTL